MKTIRISEEYQLHSFEDKSDRFEALEIKFIKGVCDMGWIGVGEEYELLLRLAYKDLGKVVYVGNVNDIEYQLADRVVYSYWVDCCELCGGEEWYINFKINDPSKYESFEKFINDLCFSYDEFYTNPIQSLKSACGNNEWIIIEKI
jgi:hypothetical protein